MFQEIATSTLEYGPRQFEVRRYYSAAHTNAQD